MTQWGLRHHSSAHKRGQYVSCGSGIIFPHNPAQRGAAERALAAFPASNGAYREECASAGAPHARVLQGADSRHAAHCAKRVHHQLLTRSRVGPHVQQYTVGACGHLLLHHRRHCSHQSTDVWRGGGCGVLGGERESPTKKEAGVREKNKDFCRQLPCKPHRTTILVIG